MSYMEIPDTWKEEFIKDWYNTTHMVGTVCVVLTVTFTLSLCCPDVEWIVSVTPNYIIFNEFRFQSITAKRAFYLSNSHKRCDGDTGWLVVKEDVITKPCKVDQVSETTIWYSGLTTKDFFNGKSFISTSIWGCFI